MKERGKMRVNEKEAIEGDIFYDLVVVIARGFFIFRF